MNIENRIGGETMNEFYEKRLADLELKYQSLQNLYYILLENDRLSAEELKQALLETEKRIAEFLEDLQTNSTVKTDQTLKTE